MKDLDKLFPPIKEKALKLQQLAKERLGLKIIITQTLRTEDEQRAIYAQGRQSLANVNQLRLLAGMGPIPEKDNKVVTKAASSKDSYHGYGLAFDIAITDSTGKRIDWSKASDWNDDGISDWIQVGKLAKECELEWGGLWSSFPDIPHYQDSRGLTIKELKAGAEIK